MADVAAQGATLALQGMFHINDLVEVNSYP